MLMFLAIPPVLWAGPFGEAEAKLMSWENQGKVAYEAYARSTGGLNFNGHLLPRFEDLPPSIQETWVFCVRYTEYAANPSDAQDGLSVDVKAFIANYLKLA